MQNFSDVISLFEDLPSVTGVLLIDGDGLTLAGSFGDKAQMAYYSPILHMLLNDIFRHLGAIGTTANQVCFVQDSQMIIVQPVHDVLLVVCTKKNGLDVLQSRFSNAVSMLQRITAPDFSNT